MKITIQEALPQQADTLSIICQTAKAHWGYTQAQLDGWRDEFLTIRESYIEENSAWVALDGEQIAGFGAIINESDQHILDHLWILPDYIGKGVGKKLFHHIAQIVPQFIFTSDPNADGFYRKMGAVKIDEEYSVLQDKMLTVFQYPS